ncbi:exo-alpha-sialidase [Blastopirellula sp. J2-11]|uniref:exo-alpha-sialidase n=1 Tax=Blastopirellula sp. J2-11 TaxID=2943192 RepID=UPI0021C83496|nr:exo-alpha-sialidase [Blastopirellula sp. J2-11]UUO07844.1 exo-alpha-sialidase [Blastopirellula sp. J2-11]
MLRTSYFGLAIGLALIMLTTMVEAESPGEPAKILSVKKIWDQAPYNAFTDLVRFKEQWFCVFREGAEHVSKVGSLRVLKSIDGENWESAALITSETADLRDAKISVTPDGKLCLAAAGAMHQPAAAKHQSYVWYSKDGSKWSDAIEVGDPNFWLWRVTWHNGVAYGVGYSTMLPRAARFYKSEDGKTFKQVGEDFAIEGYMNETGLVFQEDGTALCLIRRDGDPSDALLGTSKAPYTDWTWKSVGEYVGGPQMIQLEDGRFIVGGRKKIGGSKTQLWRLDPTTAKLTKLATLPSGGDNSYPGLVFQDGKLWVSYFSSHEGKTSIYLAQVELPAT